VEGHEPEGRATDIALLREEIEKLVLLEEVAERRQQMIEERLERAVQAGLTREQIRNELGLSKDSIRRLLDQKTPDLAERLGISEETAENLSQPIG
jgi:dihydropteroate synthase